VCTGCQWKGANIMTLKDGHIGRSYIVKKSILEPQVRQRLEALGLIDGTKIQFLNQNTDGAVIFKVRGTRLAVGERIAEQIYVAEVTV
jgi:ferrous iron transport protein A